MKIRAHNLLCLQGFVGLGYSRDFSDNMQDTKDYLTRHPETEIEITASADTICEWCPHLEGGVCMVDGPVEGVVDNATRMDYRVLEHLGLVACGVKLWSEILYIVGQKTDSGSIEQLCGVCRWRETGHCSRALDELHRKVESGEIPPPSIVKSGLPNR